MNSSVAGGIPVGDSGYRRRIHLVSTDNATVVANLEDDFHRFRVTLEHDGSVVRSLRGEAIRYPWSACPGADALLKRFDGVALFDSCTALAGHDDPKQHC